MLKLDPENGSLALMHTHHDQCSTCMCSSSFIYSWLSKLTWSINAIGINSNTKLLHILESKFLDVPSCIQTSYVSCFLLSNVESISFHECNAFISIAGWWCSLSQRRQSCFFEGNIAENLSIYVQTVWIDGLWFTWMEASSDVEMSDTYILHRPRDST